GRRCTRMLGPLDPTPGQWHRPPVARCGPRPEIIASVVGWANEACGRPGAAVTSRSSRAKDGLVAAAVEVHEDGAGDGRGRYAGAGEHGLDPGIVAGHQGIEGR